MTSQRSSRKGKGKGFNVRLLHPRKEHTYKSFMTERVTFWVAVCSLIAFVTGNMMGQYGFQAFVHSVIGGFDDSLIVYEGTVAPIAKIPDPVKWAKLGGDFRTHMFSQAPNDILMPLPEYKPYPERDPNDAIAKRIYAVDNCGTYETGYGEGAHAGIDIIAPQGTPVQSVMNGYVEKVADQKGGYGKYVMIRYPNVPDPKHSSQMTTLYGIYAHLSEQLVGENVMVKKGQTIGLVGNTGNASTYHLHFQMDRGDAPTEPFWPFTTSEAGSRGLDFTGAIDSTVFHDKCVQYTVSGMLYVQANYAPATTVVHAAASSSSVKVVLTAAQLRQQRLEARLSKRSVDQTRVAVLETPVLKLESITTQDVSSSSSSVAGVSSAKTFASVDIQLPSSHNGRDPVKVHIRLLDANGNIVKNPDFSPDFYLRTAYGQAEFNPSVLTPLDFKDGEATVEMRPTGRQTVVIDIKPYDVLSRPIKYEEQ